MSGKFNILNPHNEGRGVLMRNTGVIMSLISAALIFSLLFALGANAEPTVVIDEENITYDIETPDYNDTVTITAPVIVVDADIVKVELIWMLCIEEQCYLPTTVEMTDAGSGNYEKTIGPFDERDENGKLYMDIGFTVKATYTDVGGGEEMTTESETIEIYFDQSSATPVDSDTDTDTDTEDDEEDSPMGFEVLVIGVLIGVGIIAFRKERNN